jgi:midasin
MDDEPRIRHLCSPALVWLLDATPDLEDCPVSEPQSEKMPQKGVIDKLLLVAQSVRSLRLSLPSQDLDQLPDNYIAQCEMLSDNLSQVVGIESVVKAVNSFVDELMVSPPADWLALIQTIIPFTNAYLRLVQNYLFGQAQLAKASFKLSYTLCRVVLSLAQKGFCKPAEMEEESTGAAGQGDEVLDGTGLGQGTGGKNVSDEIQDESQVEGLRDEQTNENEPAGTTDDDAIEMEELGGGDVQDVEGDDDDTGSEAGSEKDVDEEVGKNDPLNPDTVDEKLWGDEKVPGENAEGQSSKEASGEKQDTAEVMAKEDQDKHTSKQSDREPPPNQDVDESADMNDEEMPDEHPVDAGKQMDNFVPEANTLDLPDDLDLNTGDDGQDDNPDIQDDAMDDGEDEPEQGMPTQRDPEPVPDEVLETSQEDFPAQCEDNLESDSRESPTPDAEDDQLQPDSVAQPDFSEGGDQAKEPKTQTAQDPPSGDKSQDATPGAQTAVDATGGSDAADGNEATEGRLQDDLSVFRVFFF